MHEKYLALTQEQIKLVVWDLDETFWEGTLSEEGIKPIEANIKIVKELTNRGIINSIASKNDFEQAKKVLTDLGLWDYFVFPHIAWEPKGNMVKNIIDKAQLRDNNVLFIDDNHLNLKEVLFYNKNISVSLPDVTSEILSLPQFKGKDDKEHSRLKQYKILEKKELCKQNFTDNNEFLRASGIIVSKKEAIINNSKRILEMIERTNQLNFTKNRINFDDFSALLKNPDLENTCIYVKDNYGDYGLVGFYSYSKSGHKLLHFLFSCRIMNLGVEQFIYAGLNFPEINIIKPVSCSLNKTDSPDWINSCTKSPVKRNGFFQKINFLKKKIILMKGGCDIGAIVHYLNSTDATCINDLRYSSKRNNFNMLSDNLEFIKQSLILSDSLKKKFIDEYFFVDKFLYKSKVYEGNYDVLVISLLSDYDIDFFKDKETETTFPVIKISNINVLLNDFDVVRKAFKENRIKGITKEDLERVKQKLEYIGPETKEMFKENLEHIASSVDKQIIFINGPEVQHPEDASQVNNKYIDFNSAIDEVVQKYDNCHLADVRKFIKSAEDMTDIKTHYRRHVYIGLANEISQIIGALEIKETGIARLLKYFKALILNFIYDFLKKPFSFKDVIHKIIRIRIYKDEKIIKILGVYLLNIQNEKTYDI